MTYRPGIQEKLVEVLKGPPGAMHVEAYLTLRVLMLRMSLHLLSNLWPIVLTELVRLYAISTVLYMIILLFRVTSFKIDLYLDTSFWSLFARPFYEQEHAATAVTPTALTRHNNGL